MPDVDPSARRPLTRDRVIHAAADLADRGGLGALTMRRLGAELGVEAMALYRHVANKEEILDGLVELVIGEIEVPGEGADWREAMRRRAISARAVLRRHSWAIGLLETRRVKGPAAMRYLDAVLGSLRSAGLSIDGAAHAFWLLDCYVYGHVVQEASMSAGVSEEQTDPGRPTGEAPAAPAAPPAPAGEYPNLAAMEEHARTFGYTFDGEFEFGLELILDALDERRSR